MNEPDKKWEPFLYISFDDRWMASPWFGEILWNVCRPLIQLQWELSSADRNKKRLQCEKSNLSTLQKFFEIWTEKRFYCKTRKTFDFCHGTWYFFKCARASKFNATSSSPDNKKGSERCMISFFQLHTTISCLVVHLKLLNKAFIIKNGFSGMVVLTFGKGWSVGLVGVCNTPCVSPVVHVFKMHHGVLWGHRGKRNTSFRGTSRPGAEEWEQVILN